MLRKEKRVYRFSEKVEKELKELGFEIGGRTCGTCQYVDDSHHVYIYSDYKHPFISIDCYINEYHPSLQEFSAKMEKLKTLVFKIHKIIMQDYSNDATAQEESSNDQI